MPVHTLRADFRNFIYDRIEQIFPEKESKTYADLQSETERLCQGLKRLLSENDEARAQLLRLIDRYGEMSAESNRLFYNKGFADGIRTILLNLIGVD